jgi:hypothetical protein
MLISGRFLLTVLAIVIIGVGIVGFTHYGGPWQAWVNMFCGVATLIVLNGLVSSSSRSGRGKREPDDMSTLSPQRRRELVRGTSLYLRELHYRYSIRLDSSDTGEHRCFSAEVNTVRLGFVPVVIIDNTTDRQGHGYVAFVHDGKRWRGPGLPCPAGQVEAVRHAAKCVAPLATEEETRFD